MTAAAADDDDDERATATVPFAARCWQHAEPLARRALESAFVVGVRDGTLAPSCFARYLRHDAHFLCAFARMYAQLAAAAPNWREVKRFNALCSGVVEEVRRVHERDAYGAVVHARRSDDRQEPDGAPARAYIAFLLDAVQDVRILPASGGASRERADAMLCAVAAMTPCMVLYAYIGRELSASVGGENEYREWIGQYAGAEFQVLASEMEQLLDDMEAAAAALECGGQGRERRAERRRRAMNMYEQAMQFELDFFTDVAREAVE